MANNSGVITATSAGASGVAAGTYYPVVQATNAAGSGTATVPIKFSGGASGGSTAFTLPTGDVVHYISPTGNDGNNGLTTGTAWATPNHALNCGDVIVAAPGNYNVLQSWGTVSNCPSTTGGVDGTGGVYFAVLLCGGTFVGACEVNHPTGHDFAIDMPKSNWAVEGWLASEGYVNGATGFGFTVNDSANAGVVHHIAWINDISQFNGSGFTTNSEGANNGPGYGVDYWAVVGNIAQDSAGRNDGFWDAAIDMIGVKNLDTTAGTHIFVDGNFARKCQQTTGGSSDGECFMTDSWDVLGYTQTAVFKNNIWSESERFGFTNTYNGNPAPIPTIKIYNNTSYPGMLGAYTNDGSGANYGDINSCSGCSWHVYVYNNIVQDTLAHPHNAGGSNIFADVTGASSYVSGNTGANPPNSQNIFKGAAGTCGGNSCDSGNDVAAFSPGTIGVNTYIDPAFNSQSTRNAQLRGVH
jgi:hypothetical protein